MDETQKLKVLPDTHRIMAIATFIIALIAPAGEASAQPSDPPWIDDMTFELLVERQCDVSYLMNMREGELGGEPTYEARVKCADGRMFDASRIGNDTGFSFTACDAQLC